MLVAMLHCVDMVCYYKTGVKTCVRARACAYYAPTHTYEQTLSFCFFFCAVVYGHTYKHFHVRHLSAPMSCCMLLQFCFALKVADAVVRFTLGPQTNKDAAFNDLWATVLHCNTLQHFLDACGLSRHVALRVEVDDVCSLHGDTCDVAICRHVAACGTRDLFVSRTQCMIYTSTLYNVYTCVILSDTFLCVQVTNTVQVGVLTKFIADKSGATFGRRRAAIDASQLAGVAFFDGDTVAQYFFGTAIVSLLPPLFAAIQENAKSVFRLIRKSRLAHAMAEGAGRKMQEIKDNPSKFVMDQLKNRPEFKELAKEVQTPPNFPPL